jgi:hypothetical protein
MWELPPRPDENGISCHRDPSVKALAGQELLEVRPGWPLTMLQVHTADFVEHHLLFTQD